VPNSTPIVGAGFFGSSSFEYLLREMHSRDRKIKYIAIVLTA